MNTLRDVINTAISDDEPFNRTECRGLSDVVQRIRALGNLHSNGILKHSALLRKDGLMTRVRFPTPGLSCRERRATVLTHSVHGHDTHGNGKFCLHPLMDFLNLRIKGDKPVTYFYPVKCEHTVMNSRVYVE